MSIMRIAVDPENSFGRKFSELERRQLPFATQQAINATAFETRERWKEIMPHVFDRPTTLTTNAVLYTKATKQKLEANVFIRDEVFKGTPPVKYLLTQVEGGQRRRKSHEVRLGAQGILPAGMFAVPGKFAQKDAYGNMPGSQLNAILSQLGARYDVLQNQTEESRARRQKRERRAGGPTTDYVAFSKTRGNRLAGVYQRTNFNFSGSKRTAIRPVLVFVKRVNYKRRYDIFVLAQNIYDSRFASNFNNELEKAVSSAWARSFQ